MSTVYVTTWNVKQFFQSVDCTNIFYCCNKQWRHRWHPEGTKKNYIYVLWLAVWRAWRKKKTKPWCPNNSGLPNVRASESLCEPCESCEPGCEPCESCEPCEPGCEPWKMKNKNISKNNNNKNISVSKDYKECVTSIVLCNLYSTDVIWTLINRFTTKTHLRRYFSSTFSLLSKHNITDLKINN